MPGYEITIAGRMGPVVASCLPGLRTVVPAATVLRAIVANRDVVVELLEVLAEHGLTPIDLRIDQCCGGSSVEHEGYLPWLLGDDGP